MLFVDKVVKIYYIINLKNNNSVYRYIIDLKTCFSIFRYLVTFMRI